MQCRYCLESSGDFIFPCSCKTPVHAKCLNKWIDTSNRDSCEICTDSWHSIEPISDIFVYYSGDALFVPTGVLFIYAGLCFIEASILTLLIKFAVVSVLLSSTLSFFTLTGIILATVFLITGTESWLYWLGCQLLMEIIF